MVSIKEKQKTLTHKEFEISQLGVIKNIDDARNIQYLYRYPAIVKYIWYKDDGG